MYQYEMLHLEASGNGYLGTATLVLLDKNTNEYQCVADKIISPVSYLLTLSPGR